MTTRIGLVSDVHATPAPVQEALQIFSEADVDMILCAGDIAGYGDQLPETIDLLIGADCKTVIGNHEVWYLQRHSKQAPDKITDFFNTLPPVLDQVIDGKTLYMVHAQPPAACMGGIRLLDENGEPVAVERKRWTRRLAGYAFDVLVVGHTHQVFAEWLGETFVINPGSTCFNHSCAILDLPVMSCRWFALGDNDLLRSWNWSKSDAVGNGNQPSRNR